MICRLYTLGKFIMLDDRYKPYNGLSIARILIEIDVSWGLFESMEMVVGDKSYTQTLDYVNFPLHFVACH